ncbi:2-ketocyclohexanecarboxyl-CoA hydrolase [Rhodococcus sp. 15-725-2-2b]|uniref:enoyl-CoA hydratase/isomerase family protein n=1 Tax=unclassified Rhodococcus (in: high G+C Gram-positive bacteria) TaxID=192944 RepID=UPI000B9B9F83|nr:MULTISPECIES: enoyl-CoA hydratase/isomerase family protein [unclassified Rhodococcus (in: high G+C Gram-positive bacteria)]OZC61956.1 2-ketocyclohexanecarboxyl-CoA hydrolase [Rhodococcus sp. 06-470-2]OZC64546.1 2-ketocyclohexanecarboxyl-CoA hydrolase [Rhodococcus sp. 06-469-3-2]OZD51180.1 2-ketocyclohexanecarboxyl-CoA hydrolase [Rhodococcus sp. 06-1477-1A]OZE58085.1 2-ketocyclohexanecarboxyl-CoA hydrolase [Rhodococcus sp. 05-2221-1B]OZE71619.1 2-ketocyclohexanecarboxyl-CoA hydrolase [Rhodoc
MTDIVVSVADGVGTVRLNRPDRGNSVTPDVVQRMGEAVTELAETDSVSAVVLTGTGKVFCAGADVREMYGVYTGDGPDALMDYLADIWMPAVQVTVRMLWGAPVPVVAAYNGAATAGGLDFGLACDVRIASSRARFAESYVNLGMVPVAGGAYLLPSLIGSAAALRLLATGEFISAESALALGMVGEVREPDELMDRAQELAHDMTHGPSATYASVKKITRAISTVELDAALRASLAANIELIARPDVRTGILAVMERYSAGSSS